MLFYDVERLLFMIKIEKKEIKSLYFIFIKNLD